MDRKHCVEYKLQSVLSQANYFTYSQESGIHAIDYTACSQYQRGEMRKPIFKIRDMYHFGKFIKSNRDNLE